MEKVKKNTEALRMKPRKRSLEELSLIDDFLFQEIISRGEAGEEICRILLSTILGRPIGRVRVTTQKVLAGFDTNQRGIRRIYLYTKGTEGNPSQELRDMLKYMENSIAENVTNADIRAIHEQVDAVKRDKEVGVQYMKSWEREMLIREEGKVEGKEVGKQEERRRLNTLILRLTEDCRADDIVKAAQDEGYQRQLLEEYGLVDK